MLDESYNFGPEVEAPARSRAPRLSQLFQEVAHDGGLPDGLCLDASTAASCRHPTHVDRDLGALRPGSWRNVLTSRAKRAVEQESFRRSSCRRQGKIVVVDNLACEKTRSTATADANSAVRGRWPRSSAVSRIFRPPDASTTHADPRTHGNPRLNGLRH
jgi:hypothetical protein